MASRVGTIVKGETYIKGWYIGIKGGYNSEGLVHKHQGWVQYSEGLVHRHQGWVQQRRVGT